MGNLFDRLRGNGNEIKLINSDIERLTYEIQIVCDEIDKTDLWFETEHDIDLIDACLYQRELLNARYRYLIKKVKRLCDMKKLGIDKK